MLEKFVCLYETNRTLALVKCQDDIYISAKETNYRWNHRLFGHYNEKGLDLGVSWDCCCKTYAASISTIYDVACVVWADYAIT